MKLKHALLLGLLVHGLDGAMALPTYAESNWQFIVDANDGTLYFGRNIRHYEGMTFIEMKTEADPNGNNGDDSHWLSVFRCDAKTFKKKNGEWEGIRRDTVGEEWMKHACKSRTKLTDRRNVGA